MRIDFPAGPQPYRREAGPNAKRCQFRALAGDIIDHPEGMVVAPRPDITGLLHAWRGGDREALNDLIPVVYDELHRLARARMRRERPGHALQTTVLVKEAYLRLVNIRQVQWQDRAHFFAVSAELMRRILVDHARSLAYLKRGGGAACVSLDDCASIELAGRADFLDLDDALKALGTAG